jgi:hypothetical protein
MVHAVAQGYGLTFAIELAFFGYALKCFAGTLDPILMLVAFQWQQSDDLERTRGTETAERTGGVSHTLADRIFVYF